MHMRTYPWTYITYKDLEMSSPSAPSRARMARKRSDVHLSGIYEARYARHMVAVPKQSMQHRRWRDP